MASPMRKSGIPVKSTAAKTVGSASLTNGSKPRPSSIPVKKTKNADSQKSVNSGPSVNSPDKERDLQELEKLRSEIKEKDSTINDLNEKLMDRMNECQVLREQNEAAKENLKFSNDQQVSAKMKDLEKLLNEKETFIEKMLTNKHELERKFEVELDMLKNQHEVEVLSLQQRLEDAHQEKLDELETSLNKEKLVNGRLLEQLEGTRDQNSSAEINILHEELMSTKLRYENTIFDLKQELENEKAEKEKLVMKRENERKEMENIKEKHNEEMETLKYLVQEKDILIHDLKNNEKSQVAKLYSDEDVTTKLDELRRELTKEHEQNIKLANELWRKKFDEQRPTDSERTRKDDDEHQDTQYDSTDKLQDEISDLKEQIQESNELREEQSELLEIQEKEIEELKESKKEFEERYATLFKEVESKWQSEFSESEIIEKIKSHYEMEIERLHSDLEQLQNDNSKLQTEIDLMANDFDGGQSRVGGPIRRSSVTARIEMKAEIEDYKVQLVSLERDLQHALNQNERLKLESGVKNGDKVDSKVEELNAITSKIDMLQQEKEKLISERDEFRVKFEENKKEKKKLEKDVKIRDEERMKVEEELTAKNKEIALLKEQHEEDIKRSEIKILEMKANIEGLTSTCEKTDKELVCMRETLQTSKNHEQNLEQTIFDLKGSEAILIKQSEDANSKISNLEKELKKVNSDQDNAKEESSKIKNSEERLQTETKKRVTELENKLAQGKVANEALKMKYDKVTVENEMMASKIRELEATISKMKPDTENSARNVTYENVLSKHVPEKSTIDEDESRLEQKNEEYESLTRKYEESCRENESKSRRIGEVESLLCQKDVEYEKLFVDCNELRKKNQISESRIASLEDAIRERKSHSQQMESLNTDLRNEKGNMTSKISELENMLKQSKEECAQWKRNNENLFKENESMTSGSNQLEASLNESKVEYRKLNENHQKVLEDIGIKVSQIEKLEKERTQFRKQITAFEKKIVMQEREKKVLEEKIGSLDEIMEGQKKDISGLKEKCESYDWKNTGLETQLEALRNTEGTLKTYTERNQELLAVIEEATREKNVMLAKQAELLKENKELKDERDTLKDEKGHYESERDQDSSEHERKLETVQKKLKEKDRVLNETKKHCRQLKESEKQLKESVSEKEQKCLELEGKVEELNSMLKHLSKEKDLNETQRQNKDLESFEEKNKRCLELEEKLEQINRKFNTENRKLKQLLEETKTIHNEKEQALQDQMVKQKNNFAHELKSVQEEMKQSAEIEMSRLTQQLQEKQESDENKEIRKDLIRLGEENHTLRIKLDDLGIEISKEKEEKYKAEKLKDQFRFQVQNLQERLDAEQEKISELQNEHIRTEKMINEERKKLLETLNEYESKNTRLISNIEKASSVVKTTKDKYAKLKERYATLAKKYTKVNQERLNKSDVQVGPDTSVDFSLIVEDLERSKQAAEETNFRLRAELDELREEIGRSEYQVKAVRKANVVLMKQSRCLYQESEEQKRLDEERTKELQKYREMKESLQEEKESWTKEREMLENKVYRFVEETAMLKRANEEYFLAKNKKEIELKDKASECVLHSRQIERLKGENEFLYQQGRKLQAELEASRMNYSTSTTITSRPDENQNIFSGFSKELQGTFKDFGSRKVSKESKLSESTNNLSFDEGRNFTPQVFNNEKIVGDKVIENSTKTATKSSLPSNKTYSGKDTNVQISRNIINNDFETDKYLGKTYWDTLEFLKKK